MLESETIEGEDLMLDLLHDLAWYNDMGKYVTEKEREEYEHHAQQLYDAVYKGVKTYRELAHSADPEVSQSAKSLLAILTLAA